MKRISKPHLVLFIINLAMLAYCGSLFWARQNYEFIGYMVVVGGAIVAVVLTLKRVPYTLDCLIGMTIWAAMHMAGGGILLPQSGCLYNVMIWPISEHVFRYDQLVHIWGFGSATLLMHCLLVGHLRRPLSGKVGLGIVLVMAGLGMGALNEIIEFMATLAVPDNGVGGYMNTALDMCANLIGAVLGVVYLGLRGRLA